MSCHRGGPRTGRGAHASSRTACRIAPAPGGRRELVDGRSAVVTILSMTRLAQRVGHRARLAALCVALAVAGVPGHASAAPVVAAAVEVSSALHRADPLSRAAPTIAPRALARRRPQRQTADANTARPYVPCTPLFITHRALLR